MSVFSPVYQVYQKRWLSWLDRRIPSQSKIRLNKNQIFILPTRYGVTCSFILGSLFLGGVNYSNSLILMITFWLSGMFCVSILHTFRNLLGIQIEAVKSEGAVAGEPVLFCVRLSKSPSVSHESIKLYWKKLPGSHVDLVKGEEEVCYLSVPTIQRGLLKPGRLCIETSYPVGFLRAWTWVDLEQEAWVYPAPQKTKWVSAGGIDYDAQQRSQELGADDFDGLKAYQAGDPLRHVHWKTYARTEVMYSKTFITPQGEDLWLEWQDFSQGDSEVRLSALCYWVLRLSREKKRYGLKLPNGQVELGQGIKHQEKCLELLARYEHTTFDELGRSL